MDNSAPAALLAHSYRALVLGAHGAIGAEFVKALQDDVYCSHVETVSRAHNPGFDLLDADHHALEGHIHDMADATNALLRHLAQASPGSRDAAAALLTRTAGFERFINRHLLDEEDLVVPVILHHAPDI